MELSEIKSRRDKLSRDIVSLLNNFQIETGICIREVEVCAHLLCRMGDSTAYMIEGVNIPLEI